MNFTNLFFCFGIILLIPAMILLIMHPNQTTSYETLDLIVGGITLFISGLIISPRFIDASKLR